MHMLARGRVIYWSIFPGNHIMDREKAKADRRRPLVERKGSKCDLVIDDVQEEMKRLRLAVERGFAELEALTARHLQMVREWEERDCAWLDELDAAVRDFEDDRRHLVVAAAHIRSLEVSAAPDAVSLPSWRPRLQPFWAQRNIAQAHRPADQETVSPATAF